MEKKQITVIGSLNYDILLKQARLPEKGETYTVNDVTIGAGGKGGNQAVQCSKMGIKTNMIGALGRDLFGDYIINQLQDNGLNVENIKRTKQSTGLGINNILSDGTIYANIVKGANFALSKEDINDIKDKLVRSKIVILQLEIPTEVTEYAIDLASKNDCFILLNAAPAKPISAQSLSKVDCLIVNESEATYYCKQKIEDIESAIFNHKKLLAKVKKLLIITLGEKGSLVFQNSEVVHVPALKVSPLDTTGAGDTFVGTFAAKLIEGVDLIEAVKIATIASSLTISKYGTQSIMPDKKEVESVYQSNKITEKYF